MMFALRHLWSIANRLMWLTMALLSSTFASTADSPPKTLDLSQYRLTFSEDFNKLDVSAWGPSGPKGSRWIAHTPWAGDFGDAQFADPRPTFPFTIKNGMLRIEARKTARGKWLSGLLASADGKQRGFQQKFGYFEIRTKFPPGPGIWSAFWLVGNADPDTTAEVDVIEYYGAAPDNYQSVLHVWAKNDKAKPYGELKDFGVPYGSLTSDFHTYGVSIDEAWTVFYRDRVETWRVKTPPEYSRPMMILLNLALGGGWPIDKTPNPSFMYVDYVRAYQHK